MRLLVIQHEAGCPPDALLPVAREAGFAVDVVSVADGDAVPRDATGAEAIAVLGGAAGLADLDANPHLGAALDLIRDAHRRSVPTLGICLGAQLAASALGGRVHAGADGPEIGAVALRRTAAGADDPVTAAVPDGARLFQFHRDVLVEPPGAVRLLTAPRYPAQGFRHGAVWALQCHPEVTGATVAGWCTLPGVPEQLAALGLTASHVVAEAEGARAQGRRVLAAWCRMAAEQAGRRAA